MKIELVNYREEKLPHGFEATPDLRELDKRVDVGRINIKNEATGKYTWFAISAGANKQGRPFVELVAIDQPQDRKKKITGKWRKPLD